MLIICPANYVHSIYKNLLWYGTRILSKNFVDSKWRSPLETQYGFMCIQIEFNVQNNFITIVEIMIWITNIFNLSSPKFKTLVIWLQHASLLAAVAAETAGITTNALQPLAPISTLSEEVRRHAAQVAATTEAQQQVVVTTGVHPSPGMWKRWLS